MLDTRLLSLVPGAVGPLAASVVLHWLALVANIALFFVVGSFVGDLLAGAVDEAAAMGADGVISTAANLLPESQACEQLSLFESADAIAQRDRQHKLDQTVDALRQRFGNQSVMFAHAVKKKEPSGKKPPEKEK